MGIFKDLPLLGILRGICEDEIEFIGEIAANAGLTALEITMNTVDASRKIREMKQVAAKRFAVGAGTVLSLAECRTALDAGASFIVMPTFVTEVVNFCVLNAIPVFPGALTPTEIWTAWDAGATMVKVFPANVFGPEYFKDLLGPMDKTELLACGGVNASTLFSYFEAGARGAAFGGSVFRREWIRERNTARISESLDALIRAYRQFEKNEGA